MKLFCDVDCGSLFDSKLSQLNHFFVNKRPHIKNYLMEKIDTGNVSKQAYGTHIRKVEIARGNR